MKTLFYLVLFLILPSTSHSQFNNEKQIEDIKKEGLKLYRSEMASWHGTDLFTKRYKNTENIGGYFSYAENEKNICVFFSKAVNPSVIGTITFDDLFDIRKADVNLTERKFSKTERNLHILRTKTKEIIASDTILFKHYNNTKYNVIPLIEKDINKVYILTGSTLKNIVIFGNDYLLRFNKKNELIDKKSLHKNIIPIEYGNSKQEEFSVHNHLEETGDFLTPTDVCTLMLYGKFTPWQRHLVMSKNYLNFWMIHDQTYEVMTMDEVEKFMNEPDKEK
ncbi:MAG TPA: hypothetical protein VLY87_00440 [Flavobacterium sp.]|nr:hypothetical protein [Flavobacterium sp.]